MRRPRSISGAFSRLEGNLGEGMGLAEGWSSDAVSAAGNYGEMFERNLGAKSPLALSRTVNNLRARRAHVRPADQ